MIENVIFYDIVTYVSPVLAILSFITCLIMICLYRKISFKKSVILKMIFCICLCDFTFECLTFIAAILGADRFITGIIMLVIGTLFLSSVLTSTFLGRICYKTISVEIYDPNTDFIRTLVIIFLFTSAYITIPLFDNGVITYQKFASMGYYQDISSNSLIAKILAIIYINCPFVISVSIISHSYYKIYTIVSESIDESDLRDSKLRLKCLMLYVGWQIILLAPLVVISDFTMNGDIPPDWILNLDMILTRAAGLVNCLIYFFIRVKKPDMLKSNLITQAGFLNDYKSSIFTVETISERSNEEGNL